MNPTTREDEGPVRLLNVLRLREERRADAEDILSRLMAHAEEDPRCTSVSEIGRASCRERVCHNV